jgi:hypothetical protein
LTTFNLVLVMTDAADIDAWLATARRMIPPGGEIHVRGMVTVDDGLSLSEGLLPARALRDALSHAAIRYDDVHDDTHVYVDYAPFARVLDYVTTSEADLVLAQWAHPNAGIGGFSAEAVLDLVPCDTVLLSGTGWHEDGDVLLSLRGGPNITLGVRVALALAGENHAITLFHAADQRRTAPDLQLISDAVPQIRRVVAADTDIVNGIVSEAGAHKAIVMGASFRRPSREMPSGTPVIADVAARTGKPIVLVRGSQQESFDFHVPRLVGVEQPLSTRVDQWFAENTFHSSEFADLNELMRLKERQGVSISIALPALNEAETVGHVIDTLKTALMDEIPLVDEIVLIDSDSTDETVAIAQARGIPTYIHQQILAEEVGAHRGKGEALWKSLHVTRGDIVAWVDTDITNIHPRFIYGLLGPLLKKPNVQYVKGFYARPIQVDNKLQAFGGGRVTELVARPLLNLFYPELSGIIQPLSGEYAGRRAALEQLPFFTGYGVETGMLIDMHDRYGLDGIAQTDLEVRVHHNQPLVNLSRMSFAILQVFIARMEARYGVELLDKANRAMKFVVQEPERFALEIAAIGDVERPPMITIEAYHQARQRA